MDGRKTALLVAVPLVGHLTGEYVVGIAQDEWLSSYKPNIASILFTLAVALLLTRRSHVPATPKPWTPTFQILLEIAAMSFYISVALRLIWLPLTSSIDRAQAEAARVLCKYETMRRAPYSMVIKALNCEQVHVAERVLLAAWILYNVTIATGIDCQIKAWYRAILRRFQTETPCAMAAAATAVVQAVPVVVPASASGGGDNVSCYDESSEEEQAPTRPCKPKPRKRCK